jgi:hypothetical protein
MRSLKITKHGPEWRIQNELKRYLAVRGWLVEATHGNAYQKGFPDLYLYHPQHRQRWVDCKSPIRHSLTRAQRTKWPRWEKFGVGIWILTAATQEQYDKLFGPPNWRAFFKSRAIPNVDRLLDQVTL